MMPFATSGRLIPVRDPVVFKAASSRQFYRTIFALHNVFFRNPASGCSALEFFMQTRSARTITDGISGSTRVHTKRRRCIRGWAEVVVVSLSMVLPGCRDDDAPDPGNGKPNSSQTAPIPASNQQDTTYRSGNDWFRILDNGLTDSEREEFFHLTTGSELFPLRWMQNLINPETGELFLENPGRFGLIPGPSNPDGLPIGLTAADSSDIRSRGKMVGINCSACHTGHLTYEGQQLVIVGGSSLFDVERFLSELYLAAEKTAQTPDMLVSFVHRLRQHRQDREQSPPAASDRILSHLVRDSAALSDLTETFRSLARNAVDAEADELLRSFSRRETQTQEEVRSVLLYGFEEDVRNALEDSLRAVDTDSADVTEDQKKQDIKQLTQDFFIVARLLSGRIAFARDLAGLWKHNLPSTRGGPGHRDNIEVNRPLLFRTKSEQQAAGPCGPPPFFMLQGVRWTDWDGHARSTTDCHLLAALSWGSVSSPETPSSTVPIANLARFEQLAGKLKSPVWPEDEFGELNAGQIQAGESVFRKHCAQCHRPEMVDAQDVPHGSVYPLSEIGTDPLRLQNYLQPLDRQNYSQVLQQSSQNDLGAASQPTNHSAEDTVLLSERHPNRRQDSNGYVARRLEGIWATAPYLHNGSVPSLKHLLLPAAFRPNRFSIHRAEYDTKSVGLILDISQSHEFLFDTSLPGNSNSGHEYGTALNQTRKNALLEYLKSL